MTKLVDESKGIWIEYTALDRIQGAVRNPKEHDIGEYTEGIKKFGYVQPMIVDERTGRLVKGHGGKEALMRWKVSGRDRPYNVKEGDGGMWLVPVIRGMEFENDAEAEAYIVADNRIGELGGWDESLLVAVLGDLAVDEGGLDGTGYDRDDLDRMMLDVFGDGGIGEGEGEGTDEGEGEVEGGIEDAQERWEVRDGDVWLVGEGLVLVCGDCRDGGSWAGGVSGLGVKSVEGIVTSPPYATQRDVGYGGVGGYDGVEESLYIDWWRDVQGNAVEYLDGGGSFFVNIKAHTRDGQRVLYVMDLVIAMVREWGWSLIDEFCWERVTAPGSWPNRFKNGFEPVYQFARGVDIKFRPDNVRGDEAGYFERHAINMNTGGYYNTDDTAFSWEGALPSNRLPIKENVARVGHEAAFTWKLPAFFINAFSDGGDVWVDPFCGSGSSLVAAHRTGRRGMGIEKKPEMVALSLERLYGLTGDEPKKARGARVRG